MNRFRTKPTLQALLKKKKLHPVDLLFAERWLRAYPHAQEEPFLFLAYLLAAAREGHLCVILEKDRLFPSLDPLLDPMVISGAQKLPPPVLEKVIVREENRWYLKRSWTCEHSFLQQWERLKKSKPAIEISTKEMERRLKGEILEPEQKEAICQTANRSISLICGGPGTGKTYVAILLVKVFSELSDAKIAVSAPTGKATANIRAQLECELKLERCRVQTLHSLLNERVSGVLPIDLLVVDESSMVDAELMAKLFASLKTGTRLVLIGDKHQLPPVASGNFFADLSKEKGHVTELKRGLRTEVNEIIHLAREVKHNRPIPFTPLPRVKELVDKIADRLSLNNGIKERYDHFRVLSALRVGPYGIDNLNQLIHQEHLKRAKGKSLWIPIMITANQPSLDLFNGEVGFLAEEEKQAYFPNGKKVLESLLPPHEYAYLLSVHKSQGSEYDAVWILLPEGSEVFGHQLLYTAITRAKKEVEIFSTKSVIETMVAKQTHRLSGVTKH